MNRPALRTFLQSSSSYLLLEMTLAAIEAGDAIVDIDRHAVEEKGDAFVGHHAIVTKADKLSQHTVLHRLSYCFPDARYIAEEGAEGYAYDASILTEENYAEHINDDIFGVDSLDGSSQHARQLYEWSVSIGFMRQQKPLAGAIYAPDINGGLVVFGDVNNGVWISENGVPPMPAHVAENRESKRRMVYFGVDISLDDRLSLFHGSVHRKSQTASVSGSCALGLALVAAGRIDAFIQPTQRVWDWFGGLPLVKGAGGKVQFYRFVQPDARSRIELVDTPQVEDYNPASRNLGFIAGNPRTVDELTHELLAQYNA